MWVPSRIPVNDVKSSDNRRNHNSPTNSTFTIFRNVTKTRTTAPHLLRSVLLCPFLSLEARDLVIGPLISNMCGCGDRCGYYCNPKIQFRKEL